MRALVTGGTGRVGSAIAAALRGAGYAVVAAGTADGDLAQPAEARALVEQAQPDLVVLDLNLPRQDGHAVLGEIKADPGLRSIPVVVLTTSSAERDVRQSYQLQANCFITKPVDLEKFIVVVKSIDVFWLTVVTLPPNGH
jgi:CheY-like chemotaxis protein